MFLIAGADSEVGRAVIAECRNSCQNVIGTSRRRGEGRDHVHLDLAELAENWAPPDGTRAVCIAAAVARIADCEADPAGSERVNCTGTIELARRLAGSGIYTLFLSTNQVFDGTVPHVREDAPLSPVSAYGRQKAHTETVLRRMMADGMPAGILRLSKVVSPDMKLFTGWRDNLLRGKPIQAFEDMSLAPVPTELVVRTIIGMMRDRCARVSQLTGPRDITYLEAGRLIAREIGVEPDLVRAGHAADIGMPEGSTPGHTTLDSRFPRDAFGIVVPDAADVIRSVILR